MSGERRIEVSWDDPADTARRAPAMPGLDFIRGIRDGEIPRPPIQHLLGFELEEVDEGRVVFTAVPGERHYNPIGVVMAGFAATLLDAAMGAAVHTTLPQGVGYTTLETKFNLVRAITQQTGPVRAEGTVVHPGRTVATADSRLAAAAGGKLLAHGTSTCLVTAQPG